ncbi:hypothetical protein P4641_20455 [Halalkalibacterium halodurans]|uniref:hypothetical protein n=1 Tax=Halalkalibacterium halodurans TaxID=86665 RepID=UPI002E21AA62|nr:hypothetical protein [Halalkalibacterium halodurans]
MKKVYVSIALTGVLLFGCSDHQEDGQEDTQNVQEVQANAEAETSERNSSQIPEGYEEIYETLKNFELPEEGKLTYEEALELYPEGLDFITEDVVAYENFYAFDKETKRAVSFVFPKNDYYTGEPVDPYGSQYLGLFQTQVLDVLRHYPNLLGEYGQPLGELTEEERKLLENGEGTRTKVDNEGEPIKIIVTGWEAVKANVDRVVPVLEEFEPHLEEYEPIHNWIVETKSIFEELDTYDQENWEEAYNLLRKGTENIDKMVKVIESI